MAETIKPFDAANYLRDEEDVAGFLAAVAEDGDPAAMALALGAVARARNMAQLARDTGITREGLYKALSPGGNPQFSTVVKVAGALGFPLVFQVGAAHKPVRIRPRMRQKPTMEYFRRQASHFRRPAGISAVRLTPT